MKQSKYFGMKSLSDHKGRLKILALDHENTFKKSILEMSGKELKSTKQFIDIKKMIVEILGGQVSGVLLDPPTFKAIKKYIPDDLGVLLKLEQGYEKAGKNGLERVTKINSEWTLKKIAQSGAVGIKLMFYYRPDGSKEVNNHQHKLAEEVGELCEKYNLIYTLEPMSYLFLDDEIKKNSDSQRIIAKRKPEIVLGSVCEFSKPKYKADILKLEFPAKLAFSDVFSDGCFDGQEKKPLYKLSEIKNWCNEIDRMSNCPWVIMSSGASNAEFIEYIRLAAGAGASGYLGGQGIWKYSLSKFPNIGKMRISLEDKGLLNAQRANEVLDSSLIHNSNSSRRYLRIRNKESVDKNENEIDKILPSNWLNQLKGLSENYLGKTGTLPAIIATAYLNNKVFTIKSPNNKESAVLQILKDKLPPGLVLTTLIAPLSNEVKEIALLAKRKKVKAIVFSSLHPNHDQARKVKDYLVKNNIPIYIAEGINVSSEEDRRFWVWATKNRPYVHLKISLTSSGSVIANKGETTRLAGKLSNARIHSMRGRYDALLLGANTIRNDNPQMTYRGNEKLNNPKKIILSHDKNLDRSLKVFQGEKPLIFSGKDLNKLVKGLGKENITSVLVEGGLNVYNQFIEQSIVDEISLVWTPKKSGKKPLYLNQKLPQGTLEVVGEDIWETIKWSII